MIAVHFDGAGVENGCAIVVAYLANGEKRPGCKFVKSVRLGGVRVESWQGQIGSGY